MYLEQGGDGAAGQALPQQVVVLPQGANLVCRLVTFYFAIRAYGKEMSVGSSSLYILAWKCNYLPF